MNNMQPGMPQTPPPGMFQQMAQQQAGVGQPMMPNQGAAPGGQPPQGLSPQIMQMLQMIASQGRNGDTLLAHLTPGEKTVPPEVQTPKVLATLNKAYKDKGVSPQQFTAGSPQSSINPATSLPEYNFLSSFLPLALGIAGSVAAPELMPALAASGSLIPAAVGTGVGTAAGGLLSGQKPLQAGLSGLGAGLGGYALGNLSNGMTAMGNVPQAAAGSTGAAASGMTAGSSFAPSDISRMSDMFAGNSVAPAAASAGAGASAPWAGNSMNVAGMNFNPYQSAGSAIGGAVGNYLGAPQPKKGPAYPPGFNDPYTPVSQLKPWNQMLGQTTYNGPRANFTGYNPFTNFSNAYNFYPQS